MYKKGYNRKRTVLFIISAALSLLLFVNVIAYATTYYIDNDTQVSGYSNYITGTWNHVTGDSYAFSYDYRIHYGNYYPDQYGWKMNSVYLSSAPISIYLNNANFTDIDASYGRIIGAGHSIGYFTSINQDTAYPGWNSLGTVSLNSSYPFEIDVCCSQATFNTGADALSVTY